MKRYKILLSLICLLIGSALFFHGVNLTANGMANGIKFIGYLPYAFFGIEIINLSLAFFKDRFKYFSISSIILSSISLVLLIISIWINFKGKVIFGFTTYIYPLDFIILHIILLISAIFIFIKSQKNEKINFLKRIFFFFVLYEGSYRLGAVLFSPSFLEIDNFIYFLPMLIHHLLPISLIIIGLFNINSIKLSIVMLCLSVACLAYNLIIFNVFNVYITKMTSPLYTIDRFISFPIGFILLNIASIFPPIVSIIYLVRNKHDEKNVKVL